MLTPLPVTQGMVLLFETPRHRPEFAESDGHTYYQVMFASPDGILFEIVYVGPKEVATMTDDPSLVPTLSVNAT